MSYEFWNDFVDDWKSLGDSIYKRGGDVKGWRNPVGVLKHPAIIKLSTSTPFEFIPEPWWGNADSDELHAVIVNYNPGSGKYGQHISHPNLRTLYGCRNYQEFVKYEVDNYVRNGAAFTKLKETNNWHYNKRAIPIRDALVASGISLTSSSDYTNDVFYKSCLSIELVPWHTKNIQDINRYVGVNLGAVKSVLDFAAERSKCIGNSKLKNKVILKMSHDAFNSILKKMKANNIINNYKNTQNSGAFPGYPCINAKFSSFSLDDPNDKSKLLDIEFTCIWMPDSFRDRMGLPIQADLNWIFQHVL
jgi:hypothetical protein